MPNFHRHVEFVVRVGRARGRAALARYFEAGSRREIFDRLDEAEVIVFHDEAEHGAVGAAAEAVIELLVDADPERRRLFVVKRTAGLVLAAGLLQLHAAADHLDDVGTGDEFVDEMLGDAGHGAGSASGRVAIVGVRVDARKSGFSGPPDTAQEAGGGGLFGCLPGGRKCRYSR